MPEQQEITRRTLLVGVDLGLYDMESSLKELEELAKSCQLEVVGAISQRREAYDAATCIGEGKLEEIKAQGEALQIELLVFDCELTGAMLRNIERITGFSVIDRTMLILDIFAQRARTAEGRLQVELAQQRYRLPRLIGLGQALSRLGGGVGTRGPGETKLEVDRRHIHRRILALEGQLKDVQKRRQLLRARRKKEDVQVVAIVGYTNAGKSTLLNYLTDAHVLSEDKLFATLDPTARALTLPDERKVLLVDTVGFIRRLPHHLVKAFSSTLEEALYADLILNVCDVSDPECMEHLQVTNQILNDLGAGDTPKLVVFNKIDQADLSHLLPDKHAVMISAKTGQGMNTLLQKIAQTLPPTQRRVRLKLPYNQAGLLSQIRRNGKVLQEAYAEDAIWAEVLCDVKRLHLVESYITNEQPGKQE